MSCSLCGKSFLARAFTSCAEPRCPNKTESEVIDTADVMLPTVNLPDLPLPDVSLPDIDLD